MCQIFLEKRLKNKKELNLPYALAISRKFVNFSVDFGRVFLQNLLLKKWKNRNTDPFVTINVNMDI